MQLITLSNRRWRLWLLIIASLVLLVVIAALLPGDASPPRRHNVGGGAGTAAWHRGRSPTNISSISANAMR